ncbi:MAG: ISNCY family transposase [Acidobacteriota bacterium]|nr:ISNCY family transposase [Acidobacteriota bacterium]
MDQADRDRLVSLKKAKKKLITQKEAAEELGITERQVRRLLRKLKKHGDKAVVHALRGEPSNRKTDEQVQQQAVEILSRPDYRGFRPTLATEHLGKHYQLEASRETVRKWMIEAKLWKPRRQRVEKVHMWRVRRGRLGELVQWDTSDHDWLEGRGERLKLIAMIDDATSRYLARFVMSDSTEENMAVLKQYLNLHGRPLAFYTDKAGIFQTAVKTKRGEHRDGKDRPEMAPTQIGRALRELGIIWIPAHSPQAKGRVERSFETMQDRLVKELRIAGANTLEQANDYLEKEFIPWWNATLTVVPASADDAHRPLEREHDLAAILSHVETRQVDNDYTIHFDSKIYQIEKKAICAGLRGAAVRVERRWDGGIAVRFRDRYLAVSICEPRPKQAQPKPAKERSVSASRQPSTWNKNFELKNAPKLWQAAQGSGCKPPESW